MSLLDSVNSPEDLRRLDISSLNRLSGEIRGRIIDTVSRNGGHLASNLGVVELTIALHRVFRTPEDSIIWDVGHQCYTHKLITGRRDRFDSIRRLGGLSGFPKRSESIHDSFDTGHASTSISTALGMLEARSFLGDTGKVVAVIGDGALTGGMAFEAMNHAGQLGLPLIVVLNDNKMSISPVVGSLSRYLSRLSATARYQKFRTVVDSAVRRMPLGGSWLYSLMQRSKRAIKALFYKENLFIDLGFEYVGPIDGHDIPAMIEVFGDVRKLNHPSVVHVLTHKGRGHSEAEEDPASFHGVAPHKPLSRHSKPAPTGLAACEDSSAQDPHDSSAAQGVELHPAPPPSPQATFTDSFSATLCRAAEKDCSIVAVTAAMSKGTGLEAFKRNYPDRFHDVGIAEQHAVTFAAGLAAGGLKPVVAIYSTFMQRAVDQVFQDVALQGLHVVFALDRAGLVPEDGETHQGIYDVALFRCMPGIAILAPASGADLELCMRWALAAAGPVIVRFPKAILPPENEAYSQPVEAGRGVFVRKTGRSSILVVASGILVNSALAAAEDLSAESIESDVYSMRFLSPIDPENLRRVCSGYDSILILEECVAAGGVGESISPILSGGGNRARIIVRSLFSQPCPQGTRDELLALSGMSHADIVGLLRSFSAPAAAAHEAYP